MNNFLNSIEALGRYKLIRELGRGGMSVVYLAQDTELGREVAIKCVNTRNHATASMTNSLRSEAKLLAQLNHTNVVQLYDVVEQGNVLGLVIEYVGGDTLTQRLKQAPTKETKLKWLAEIASGLASAHNKGIAHCDLKADNILITHDNIAKIADFGIAKVKLNDYFNDQKQSKSDKVTASYFSLSPEQAAGQAADIRTDLFSLGVLTHTLMVGRHPFWNHDKKKLVKDILETPFSSNSANRKALGPRLYDLTSKSLEKNPLNRLYSADDASELFRAELIVSAPIEADSITIEIDTLAPRQGISKPHDHPRNHTKNTLLLLAGFVFGLFLLTFYNETVRQPKNIEFVAIDEIQLNVEEALNPKQVKLITSTLKEASAQTLLSLDNFALIPDREFKAVDGNYAQKAKATGATAIVTVSGDCDAKKCDFSLTKYSGNRMAVSAQRNWPASVHSLIDIRNNLRREVFLLFSTEELSEVADISESIYTQYMSVFQNSNNGRNPTIGHLENLERIVKSQPNFLPAYDLTRRAAERLNAQNSSSDYLQRFQRILAYLPQTLNNEASVYRAKISLHLLNKDYDKAENALRMAEKHISDIKTILNFKTDIAFYTNETEKLLFLDRENAKFRPSAKNLYNLATSEYANSNYDKAISALNDSLALFPNYSFALELKATIQMRLGKLALAIENYTAAIALNESSTSLSNLGLAYMLSRDYETSRELFSRAIAKSPNIATYQLNMADALKLSGQSALANSYYNHVIELTRQPKDAKDYWQNIQASAQTGNLLGAIKTLNLAMARYPNDSNVKYSAALAHALSNNQIAAAVAVEEAIKQGTGAVWFTLPWFEDLCEINSFTTVIQTESHNMCSKLSTTH